MSPQPHMAPDAPALPIPGRMPPGNPLDWFYEDHLREREICARINAVLLQRDAGVHDLAFVIPFFRIDLPRHIEDEEKDLFPLLRRRCEPEDEIARAIDRLVSDHLGAQTFSGVIDSLIEAAGRDQRAIHTVERESLQAYVMNARRHLIFENAIILPLARYRLTDDDLETLRLRMTRRRGG